jgi:hypothetical protein
MRSLWIVITEALESDTQWSAKVAFRVLRTFLRIKRLVAVIN